MPILFAALALLGLAIGSFLTVVIGRVPEGESLVSPASHCPRCEHPIRNRHNVPVIGWFALRGRCRDCAMPISARYPLIELVTAEVFVLIGVPGIAHGQIVTTAGRLLGAAAMIAIVVIAVENPVATSRSRAIPALAAALAVDLVVTGLGHLIVVASAAVLAAAVALVAGQARLSSPVALGTAGAVHLLVGVPVTWLTLSAAVFAVIAALTVVVPSDRLARADHLARLTRRAA